MKLGEFLMRQIFFFDLTQKDVAEKINVNHAKSLEHVLGIPAIVWLTYQSHDELAK